MRYALEHYYGDIVRYLFLAAALIMLITLPLFQDYVEAPTMYSIIGIAILGIAAGLTNPKQMVSAAVNFIIAIIGLAIFGYTAVDSFQNQISDDKFLLTNVILAVIFLFAVYFSMKTLRSQMLDNE